MRGSSRRSSPGNIPSILAETVTSARRCLRCSGRQVTSIHKIAGRRSSWIPLCTTLHYILLQLRPLRSCGACGREPSPQHLLVASHKVAGSWKGRRRLALLHHRLPRYQRHRRNGDRGAREPGARFSSQRGKGAVYAYEASGASKAAKGQLVREVRRLYHRATRPKRCPKSCRPARRRVAHCTERLGAVERLLRAYCAPHSIGSGYPPLSPS